MNFIANVLAGAGVVGLGLGLLIALILWAQIVLGIIFFGVVGGLVVWALYDVGAAVRGQD